MLSVFFLILVAGSGPLYAQSVGATFGEVIPLGGTPSDLVLDESRGRIYVINTAGNRVDIYDYLEKNVVGSVSVGLQPFAGALSLDSKYLYVTNNAASTLSVIDLDLGLVSQTVTLPARPEGVEVGADGRALISTQGTGVANLNNTLLIFDRTQTTTNQVQPVQFPPPPPSPAGVPAIFTRPLTTFRGKLIRTPDGRFIVGLSTINNNTQTVVYLYEAFSGTVLKTRTVTGQSTVLSMSPDGARFMAGFTLYDTQTLNQVGQMTPANIPFAFLSAFNVLQNIGGSAFGPDGGTLYSAFNVAPFSQPATRTQASTLLISDAKNLAVRLGIKLPESIVAKMAVTSDGGRAFGMSESGLLYLPLSTLFDYPILQPETTQVFLAVDDCNRGIARATVRVNNLGSGKLTFSVPNTGAALVSQVSSGVAPSEITFVMEPGRAGVVRQAGTNLYTGAGTQNTGVPINVNLASLEAINIPNTIRVYMNFRQSDQRGVIYPVPTIPNSTIEGLRDLVLDEERGRLYIANSGYNRLEVFDTRRQRFLEPIPVGQLPRQMAMGTDGATLYVANAGGESISIVDLDLRRVVGEVEFPPIPRAGNANPVVPVTMAMGLRGLNFIMSNGTRWKLVGNQATLRPAETTIPATIPGPQYMLGTPTFDYILTLAGNGTAYLYNSLIDSYTTQRQLFSNPIQSYYGPMAAAGEASFFLANGLILNNSLTVIGGVERPGTVQFGPPPQPGQPPTQTVVSGGERNIAASSAVDADRFIRLTTPVRQNINSVTRDEVRTTLEMTNLRTRSETLIGVVPENPLFNVFGAQRANISPRYMVADSRGATAYAITISGLSVIPLTPAGQNTRPAITAGARGILNSNDGTPNFRPGSFITITGRSLAQAAQADTLPPPSVLGGSCVVFNDVALPLLQTSPDQISAQIPADRVRPGLNVVQVKSLGMAQSSDPVVVTVQRP
jgi:DNA-binding beta-propeller fold protein YncE